MLSLILGGARSGKSRYAQSLCQGADSVLFLATAVPGDDPEMQARIARHLRDRPSHWTTVHAPLDPAAILSDATNVNDDTLVLLDCVTLWLSNLLEAHRELEQEDRQERILDAVQHFGALASERQVIAVSNEVGGGVVPMTPLGREFRDLQGMANQILAEKASRVALVVAGLPWVLKDS